MNNKNLRRVFLTWNNWEKDFQDREAVENYFSQLPHFKGAIIGFEIGKETQTPHLQAVIQFTQQKTFNTLREYFKNNHLEQVRSMKAAIEYCQKEGDYITIGSITTEGQRTDIEDFTNAILEGQSDMELLMNYPSQYHRYRANIDIIRQNVISEYYSKNLRKDLQVILMLGGAGVGKTRFIFDNFDIESIYRVSDYKNPFDNYKGQKVFVLDEYAGQFSIQQLLNILDIYPLQLPARYTNKWAAFETVFIISNMPYMDLFPTFNKELTKAIDRRITHITNYLTAENYEIETQKIKAVLGLEKPNIIELAQEYFGADKIIIN